MTVEKVRLPHFWNTIKHTWSITRDMPKAEYLIRKGMDNNFKMNNEFKQIIENAVIPCSCCTISKPDNSTIFLINNYNYNVIVSAIVSEWVKSMTET